MDEAQTSLGDAGTDVGADAFDERWYLDAYPDVRLAIERRVVKSALDHYEHNGKREGRFPNGGTLSKPIVHLHIPKTAGTSVRGSLERMGKRVRRLDAFAEFNPKENRGVEVVSGHFGYRTAAIVGGNIVTILRDPLDRYLSFYYFLRRLHASGEEFSDRTVLASKYSLEDFADLLDCDHLAEELSNTMVWQLAYSFRLRDRMAFRVNEAPNDDRLLEIAIANLESFALVGFQDQMGDFCDKFESMFGLSLDLQRQNFTEGRPSMTEVPMAIRRKILRWTYLDHELYTHARELYFRHRLQSEGAAPRVSN